MTLPRNPQARLRHLLVALLACWSHQGFAIQGDLDSANAHFHRAELAFVQHRFDDAIRSYAAVLTDIRTLDLEVREWFEGNACYGLACCAAVDADTLAARRWLDAAMVHRFWVFDAVTTNTQLMNVAGNAFVDSTLTFWIKERDDKRTRWHATDPIIIRPSSCDSTRILPTVIALHGGNGNLREFSVAWQHVADSLCINVIVPPGVARLSSVGYAWDFSMRPIDSSFRALLNNPIVRGKIDFERLYLAGFSQGGHAAIGLAERHPHMFRGVIVLEGFVTEPIDSLAAERLLRDGVKFYGIYGTLGYRPFLESFKQFKAECDNVGVPVRLDMVPNMVHEQPFDLPSRVKGAIAWIEQDHVVVPKHVRGEWKHRSGITNDREAPPDRH